MNKASEILSDIVVFSKYARYIPEIKRRETWDEIVSLVTSINLIDVTEDEDNTDLKGEAACAGGGCSIV